MFGYAKRDMVGKNINLLIPQPMSSRHDQYLRRYVETGKTVRARTHPRAAVHSNNLPPPSLPGSAP
jgi:PAS domain S-box-containing protein